MAPLNLFGRRPAPASPISREALADAYLRGEGIEIGALYLPLKVPPQAKVTYVDRLAVADLRKHYPELAKRKLIEPDVLDDGERLPKFADGSQDFVIANHFVEHCQDPIGAIQNFLRVLKPGGIAYLAIPDKRATFDELRPCTPNEHLLRDWREGPEWSRRGHFDEWVRLVQKIDDEADVQRRIDFYMEMDYSIHYHVWTPAELMKFALMLREELGFPFEIEAFLKRPQECVAILRRAPG